MSKGIFRSDSFVIKTLDNKQVHTGSDCVLHQLPKDKDISCHLLCVNLTRDEVSRRTIARDLSLLQPLTVVISLNKSLLQRNQKMVGRLVLKGKIGCHSTSMKEQPSSFSSYGILQKRQ
ncbi:uncharacterized protein LOC119580208 [Penaeus monodon]|uniref:uncharacterized protein LOC119580208 n=1 Tax=Penaeus monodon TaxID=6687 RepID=UPI0018A7A72C|nr:uncharacterized protein LOC119580208 [Penaeus monodon]